MKIKEKYQLTWTGREIYDLIYTKALANLQKTIPTLPEIMNQDSVNIFLDKSSEGKFNIVFEAQARSISDSEGTQETLHVRVIFMYHNVMTSIFIEKALDDLKIKKTADMNTPYSEPEFVYGNVIKEDKNLKPILKFDFHVTFDDSDEHK